MYKILIIALFLMSCSDSTNEEVSSVLVGNWKPKFLMDGDVFYGTALEIENLFINEQSDGLGTITSVDLSFDIKDDYSAYIYSNYDIFINNVIEERTEGMIGSWSATEQTFCLHSTFDDYCFGYELNNSELTLSTEYIMLILEID